MLIVLLPEMPAVEGLEAAQLHWWRTSRDGALLDSGQDQLAPLRARFPAERLRLLAPANATNLYRVAIPVRRSSAVNAALPFALEDHLGQELEELHLVAGPRRNDGRFAAAVTEHRWMEEWVQLCRDVGWRADALIPQASLHHDQAPEQGLRIQPSPWPAQSDTALVTSVDQEPVLIELGMLGFWLKQRLGQLEEQQRVVELLGYQATALGLDDAECRIEQLADNATLDAALKQGQRSERPLNLLVGPYASGMATPPWRKLRPVLVAAGVLLALLLAQQVLQGLALSNERNRLHAEIDQLFDDTLPHSRRVEPVTQFRQVLEGSGSQTSESGMGSLLYDVLASIDTDDQARIQQFRATPVEVELELKLPSFAELEKLRSKLAAEMGLNETLQGADSDSDGVTARLHVQRKQS